MPCLDLQELERVLLGRVPLSDDDAAQLERHLTECPRCEQAAEQFGVGDRIHEAVRAQAGVPPAEPAAATLITRIKSGCVTVGSRLNVAEQAGAGNSLAEDYSFLSPPEHADEIGRLGPYRVLSVLSAGGMGIVFRAEEPALKRLVALKVMRPELAARPEARRLFLREAQTAARLTHDHIVAVYRVEEANGIPYLAMPLLPGETLEARLAQRIEADTRVPVAEVVAIGRHIAEALAEVHNEGLVHGDIKPANIWLEERRDRSAYRAKLLDFGVARAAEDDPEVCRLTARAGTPSYMAPEQALGRADVRSDLYSLGCLLYELCTGRLPCYPRCDGPLLDALATARPEPPRTLNPDVPEVLSDAVLKLLEQNPGDRFQSASEIAELLTKLTATERDRKRSVLRRPWLVIGAAAALAALLVAVPQIVIRITSKDGTVTEIKVPEGAKVEIAEDGKASAAAPWRISSIRSFEGHLGVVWSVTFSRDERRVLSGGDDGVVRVWDVETGKELHRFEGHKHFVYSIAVAPDGRRVLSGAGDTNPRDGGAFNPQPHGTVCLWEVESGKELRRLEGLASAVTSVAFSGDGRRALFGHFDGTVQLWDVEQWKEVRRFDYGKGLWNVCFSPDGEKVLTSGGHDAQRLIRLWDLSSGEELRRFKGHGAGMWQSVFSPDGKRILSASLDRTARLWETETGKELRRFRHPHGVAGVAFLPDGRYALSGSFGDDGIVRLWDLESRKELHGLSGHTLGVQSVAISRDGRRAVSASHDGTVRLWEVPAVAPTKPVEKK
jgi:WD40 repeat protein/serine/threonine protein kinase